MSRVAFSPDGRSLALSSWDGTVKLWNVTTGMEVCSLRGHKYRSWGLACSPDGQTIATSSEDGSIKLWDPASGREIRSLGDRSEGIYDVAFSPDGRSLASTSYVDRKLRPWDIASGRPVREFGGHKGFVRGSPSAPMAAAWLPRATIAPRRSGTPDRAGNPDPARAHGGSSGRGLQPRRPQTGLGEYGPHREIRDGVTGEEILTLRGHTNVASASPSAPTDAPSPHRVSTTRSSSGTHRRTTSP